MAATPLAERPAALKVLGIGFIALVLFFVWLTYAFFNKTFVSADIVTLQASNSGQSLSVNGDVKLRGMIVGSIRSIEPVDGGVEMELAMKPELIDRVPAGVTGEIVPKTLFGEKFVNLIAPPGSGPDSESLRAGDVITRAEVPIEVEDVLNDLSPLLQAVEPADLSFTLTAVAQALEGRGEQVGDTLVTLNDYLREINPDVPALVDSLVATGEVADVYARELPTIGRLLENSVVTGNTVVEKRTQLAAFFDEGTRLSNTLTTFADDNGDNLTALADQGRRILSVSAEYSSIFPCFLGGMATILPRLDSVLANRTVHIDLRTLARQPTKFDEDEFARVPDRATLDATPATRPTGGEGTIEEVCDRLPLYQNRLGPDGQPDDRQNPFAAVSAGGGQAGMPYPGPNPEVYGLLGLTNSHNGKFGTDADFERAAAASLAQMGYWDASLAAVDSPHQRTQVRQLVGAMAGVAADDVPDIASLLLSPVLRGTEVQAP